MKSYYPKYMAEFLREGKQIVRCKKCGAPLRSKESRKIGYGKGCLAKMEKEDNQRHFKEEVPFIECGDSRFQQLLLVRSED